MPPTKNVRIAVLASGNGSNFQALHEASKKNEFNARIVLLVSDNPKAKALQRAAKAGVKSAVIDPAHISRQEFEQQLKEILEKEKIGLIVLAGFMRMLSPAFVHAYRERIINIHPSLLPSFKGSHAIRDAYEYGAKITGVTVHFVDEKMDHGPIILQEGLAITPSDTLESLEKRIHEVEHQLYPLAVKLLTENCLSRAGRKINLTSAPQARRR